MSVGRQGRFGRYDVLEELGRGAMGIVYKARDPKINRVVAIKTVSLSGQSVDQEREYRERFFREAETAGRLTHPGIVTVFDVGEQEQTRIPYIVMEYVAGESLEKTCTRHSGKVPVGTALRLAQELAEALDCAHGQGVVHRDLKPANILITEDGHAKIADFGVARLDLSHITLPGHLWGTPAFMSPEQLNDEPVDGRSDLFSLGVVLYAMVTGHRPFQGSSTVTVSFKLVNRDPLPATVLNRELPRGLDNIIFRAMAKLPQQRYQRGLEMARDIQSLLSDMRAGIDRPTSSTGQRSINIDGPLRHHSARPNLRSSATLLVLGALVFVAICSIWYAVAMVRGATLQTQPPKAQTSVAGAAKAPQVTAKENELSAPVARTKPAISGHASPPAVAVLPAMLQIEIEHHFNQAIVDVWVDDHQATEYVVQGNSKKRLALFHDVQGHNTHVIQVSPGKHRIRVRLQAPQSSFDQSNTVAGTFTSGQASVLRIGVGKHEHLTVSRL